jgi:hypothetical protein
MSERAGRPCCLWRVPSPGGPVRLSDLQELSGRRDAVLRPPRCRRFDLPSARGLIRTARGKGQQSVEAAQTNSSAEIPLPRSASSSAFWSSARFLRRERRERFLVAHQNGHDSASCRSRPSTTTLPFTTVPVAVAMNRSYSSAARSVRKSGRRRSVCSGRLPPNGGRIATQTRGMAMERKSAAGCGASKGPGSPPARVTGDGWLTEQGVTPPPRRQTIP